jgi:hypothetical protein
MNFVMTALMATEILIAEYIFCRGLKRKQYFPLRVVFCFLIAIAATLWVEFLYYVLTQREFIYGEVTAWGDSVFKAVYYFLIYVMTIVCVGACFKENVWTILFHCAGGYVIQYMTGNLLSLLFCLPPLRQFSEVAYVYFPIRAALVAAVYCAVYFLLLRRYETFSGTKQNIRNKAILSMMVIFLCIGLSRITIDDATRGFLATLAETIYAIVSCALLLAILLGLTENDKMKEEVDFLNELWRRDREQYKLSKENIDLINIKCHDLKHQIAALRNEHTSEQQIREVEEAVMIYNSVVKTGNEVLDVVLTEKSLLCEKNKITLTCVANGADMTFIDSMDIYSLFGNALSNAIESVQKIKEETRRCISLNVKTVGKMLSVHIENFYDGEIRLENGLPVTDKGKDYHGFGMKSMRAIAEKYGGGMNVIAKNGKFCLDIVLPVQ